MKKLLLLMAACFVMVACGSEEKKAEAPKTVVEHYQAIVEAAKAGDVVKYVDAFEAANDFAEKLEKENKEDYDKQVKDLEAWKKDDKNKEAVEALTKFTTEKAQEIAAEFEKRAKAEEPKEE